MSSLPPRAVLVTRASEFMQLIARHATRGQADFYLSSRGQSLDQLETRHRVQSDAVQALKFALPSDWSLAEVERGALARFLFAPNDIVVAVGQDGLVANLAKYLSGQPVIGITPDAAASQGILTRHSVDQAAKFLSAVAASRAELQARIMAHAKLSDGQELTALNELFIGHKSHQSARYKLAMGAQAEHHSSSGVIVSTGTGLTGWARSILTATGRSANIAPDEAQLAFFAREPWPSSHTGTEMSFGLIDNTALSITSQMNDGGVIFADGIEQDFLRFDWGMEAQVGVAEKRLNLVVGV